MSKGQLNYILALVVCLSGFSAVTAQNPCSGTFSGTVPHPEICFKYYTCFLWIGTERTCNDDHVFNRDTKECEPGKQETCEIWSQTTTTPEPPTTIQISTTTQEANPCEGQSHGAQVPHEECNKYYLCLWMSRSFEVTPTLRTCEVGNVFDPATRRCVPGDPQTCEIFETTTSPQPPTTQETSTTHAPATSTTTENPHNPCHGLWHGERVPHPDCHRYYTCIAQVPVPHTCDDYHIFDKSTARCVPGDPETCEIWVSTTSTREPVSISSTTPSTTARPPSNLEEICRNVFFGARAYPESVTQFVGCIREVPMLFQCYDDETFHPEPVNECVKLPTTTTTTTEATTTSTTTLPPTTTRVITTTLPPNLDQICEGIHNKYVVHPQTCALYVFCWEGYHQVMQCPEFKIFDVHIESCRAGNQTTCEFIDENTATATEPTPPLTETTTTQPEETEPTTTEPEETEATTTLYNPCAGIARGNVPNEDSCVGFFQCFSGNPFPRSCDDDHVFHRELLICVRGNQDTCAFE